MQPKRRKKAIIKGKLRQFRNKVTSGKCINLVWCFTGNCLPSFNYEKKREDILVALLGGFLLLPHCQLTQMERNGRKTPFIFFLKIARIYILTKNREKKKIKKMKKRKSGKIFEHLLSDKKEKK
jgi:hypothetical protein